MSHVEHEYVAENHRLRAHATRLRKIALRAVIELADVQDRATGRHEGWPDDARRELTAASDA